MTIKIPNTKNKRINNIDRKKTGYGRKVDLNDKYHVGSKKAWFCLKCGSEMEPYKQDEFGDIIMSCKNEFCLCSKDFGGRVNTTLKKLTKEMQLHERYYVNQIGSYKGSGYNRVREYQYRPKLIHI